MLLLSAVVHTVLPETTNAARNNRRGEDQLETVVLRYLSGNNQWKVVPGQFLLSIACIGFLSGGCFQSRWSSLDITYN